jgi:mannose-6-phosphate isomerase-like protein (cupin superfamily)
MSSGPTLKRINECEMIVSEKVHPDISGLKLLAYTLIEIKPNYLSAPFYYNDRETLLICSEGSGSIVLENKKYSMKLYDMIYIPEKTPFQLKGGIENVYKLGMATAPSQAQAKVVHIPFDEVRKDPARTRPMANKVVYLNFSEKNKAQNLVAGLVFFEPFTRSFPAHMHTDQEEIYHFLDGKGSIEIYKSEESKTFVYNVEKGDIASVPMEHFHPCFAQETPLVWLWVIAGERYWIGDRDQNWMAASKSGK